jgi:hypothetical protein
MGCEWAHADRAASGLRDLICLAVGAGITLDHDWARDNGLTALRQSIGQQLFPMRRKLFFAAGILLE